ncbi:MAG: hypothetical protein J5978_06315 [Spirochaetaceae bacterium]|nr:hypothetical protein [Spirochaetaceae bacterium]
MKKILTLCLSAGIQKTIEFPKIHLDMVNRSLNYQFDIAGKAVNSARVLSQLAEKFENQLSKSDIKQNITLICPLGEKNLDFWKELSAKENFAQKNILIPGFTRECCTLIENETGRVTELVVEEPKIQDENRENKTKELLELLKSECAKNPKEKPEAFLVAGSVPSYWDRNIMTEIAKIAKENNILFMADFKGKTLLDLIPNFIPEIIKINEEEFLETFYPEKFGQEATKCDTITLQELICEQSKNLANIIIVTRGEKDTILAQNGKCLVGKTEKICVKNTIGSGDAFNAGFLYEFSCSKNLEKALEMGTYAASRNAENLRPGSIF